MIWQCQGFQRAVRRAFAGIEAIRFITDMGQSAYAHQQQIFSDLHSAMTFAGNIAKMMAPIEKEPAAKKRADTRADRIKNLLRLKPPSDPVLYHALLVRDSLEHIDARLDVWSEESTDSNVLIHALVPEGAFAHVAENDAFTRYDTKNGDFSVQKRKVNLPALEKRVSKILSASVKAYGRTQRLLARLITRERPT